MCNAPMSTRRRRSAGWWPVALLGALLLMPAELAARERERGDREASPRASSGAKPSGSSAKASPSPSRSAPRSQPRASGSSRSSRSQPRASARPQPSRRSDATAKSGSSRRQRVAPRPHKLERGGYERPSRRQREVRTDSPRRNSTPATPRVENVAPVGRTEVSPPPRAKPGFLDRNEDTRRRGSERPRYRTPAERSPVNPTARRAGPAPAGRPGAGGQRKGPDDDWARRHEIDDLAPGDPSAASASGRRGRRHRPRGDGHGHRYGNHRRHHHHYGCGHYGYGHGYRHGSYHGYGFGYYSPYSYWGLGTWGPEVHVYSSGGGGSSYYREIGQGALDLDIRPETAEIYIDGSYVGVADQFDGFPTYLWLEEGTYEIAFYKEGYETIFRQYTIYPGVTIDVRDRMRPGEAVRPAGAGLAVEQPPASMAQPPAVPSSMGRIAIVATPGDAAVYLDGHFVGTAAEIAELSDGLIVESGDHMIEIIRPGYENQRVPVALAANERIDLQLDLRQPL